MGSTATASVDFTVAYTPLEIDNAYWQSGLLNSTFNLKLAAYGGVTGLGYTWSILNGSLPPGLMLDNGTGLITGTPAAAGSYFATIQVTDDGGDSTLKQFRIFIYAQQHSGTNLALNKIYSSSSNWDANQTADKAFDGNLDTNCQAGRGLAPGQGYNNSWIAVDFGVNFTFNRVRLSESGSRTEGYRIEYWNGQTWQAAFEGTTLANQPDYKIISFAEVTGSKVRTVFTSGTESTPALCEFEVYFDNRVLDGVVSEWHLDNNLKDDVGDNEGVLKGNAVYSPGKAGQAIQLDNGYVEVPDSDSLDKDLNSMTLSAWVRINSFPVQNYEPVGKDEGYRFIIDHSGNVHFVMGTNFNAWYSPGTVASYETRLSIGKWYYLVGTYDGRFTNCYINGTKKYIYTIGFINAPGIPISGSIADNSEPLRFGNNISAMDGMIDEVRLYRRALNDTEVKAVYDSYK